VYLELSNHLNPYDQVNVFNQVFYTNLGFGGKPPAQEDASLYFPYSVLESRKGTAVSLGIVYILAAQQLQMPVYGVTLPQHFVLALTRRYLVENDFNRDLREEVLFYINPLNKGAIFSRNEVKVYLRKLNVEPQPAYYLPARAQEVIRYLLTELLKCYETLSMLNKAEEIGELLELFQEG
jgi:regulator of sirC expression with transglutaminase-like and TPR domain